MALLDTGIARHPDLKGSVVKFCDFTKEGSLPGEKCYDDSGHGTHVAGNFVRKRKSVSGSIRRHGAESKACCRKST